MYGLLTPLGGPNDILASVRFLSRGLNASDIPVALFSGNKLSAK